MGGAAMRIVEERLRWYQAFILLYEKAVPIIRQITDLETLAAGELPVTLYTLAESNLTLRPILEAVRKVHEPKEVEFVSILKEFEIALSSCVKVAEAAEKYIELRERGIEDQAMLSTIISSIVLAHEYIESASKKLEILKPRVSDLGTSFELGVLPPEIYLKEMKSPSENVSPPAGPQLAIDKAADSLERGLHKLGDALVFPIERISRYARRFQPVNRKKR
jgi:hypothetical protein